MSYDGKINRKLNLIKIKEEKSSSFPDTIEYKLAYCKTNQLSFSNEEIVDYINVNYIKNDEIIEENLLNDLITFKTYKTDRKVKISRFDVVQNGISTFLSLLAVVMSFSAACLSSEFISKYVIRQDITIWIVKNIFAVFMVFSLIFLTFVIKRLGKDSISRDMKFIDNAIYTLETIKEDKYRNGIWCKKSDERYEGLELTEVKEIRTYTYKATGNKYSPRAMYERKRR